MRPEDRKIFTMNNQDGQTSDNKALPPIPPRPNELPQRYNPYGGPTPYGMGVGPGPGGFYGLGPSYNPYGMQMITNAHHQIDATFQSIQSFVQAASSISLMLESSYMALHQTFRAVTDIGDHFVRLKENFSGLMSVVTIFNTIKWFFKRILYMLNMVNEDQIWSDSLASASEAIEKGQKSIFEQNNKSSWPVLMFLGVAVGAPYMIYKLQKPTSASTKWMTREDNHYIAEALYDFDTNHDSELSLKAGQTVIVAPKHSQPDITGWLMVTIDGQRAGLVPMNYIKIVKFHCVD